MTFHSNMRSLVNRLFTPSRLRANQEFIAAYSEELVKDAVTKGSVELIKTIATPFVTLVIADLLGVPAEDRQHFMNLIEAAPPPGSLNSSENDFSGENHPMVVMAGYFARYLMERQQHPRGDILSELAHATFPDGTKPRLEDLVGLSTFIFGAGQDTSAKLLGNSMRYIVDQPGLEDRFGRTRRYSSDARGSPAARRLHQADRAARAPRYQIGDRIPAPTKVPERSSPRS